MRTFANKYTEEDITNIIITALEGGIGYWACLDNTDEDFEHLYETTDLTTSEIVAELLMKGKTIKFEDVEEDDIYELTLDKLITGLSLAKLDGVCIDVDEMDSDDADNIIQYAIFGEVVFG